MTLKTTPKSFVSRLTLQPKCLATRCIIARPKLHQPARLATFGKKSGWESAQTTMRNPPTCPR